MRIIDLYYFKTLCETRSFTLSAQVHYVSQPKISIAIKRLEEELNVMLIIRKKFMENFKITSNGLKLLKFIDYLDYKMTFLKKNLDFPIKNITIGIPSIEGKALVRNYLNRLYTEANINVNLLEINIKNLKIKSIMDKVDYYFTCYRRGEKLSTNLKIFLRTINMKLVYNKIELTDVYSLNDKVIISLRKGTYHFKALEWIIMKYNLKPKKIIFLESFESAQMLIEENIGVAVMMEGIFDYNKKIKKKSIKDLEIDLYIEYSNDKIIKEEELLLINEVHKHKI